MKKTPDVLPGSLFARTYASDLARVRMQRVQRKATCDTPSTKTRVFWMFGRHRRLVLRSEWLTL